MDCFCCSRRSRWARATCFERVQRAHTAGVSGSAHRMERGAGSTMSQNSWSRDAVPVYPSRRATSHSSVACPERNRRATVPSSLPETPFRVESSVNYRKQTMAPLSTRNSPREVSAMRKSLLFLRLVLKCAWKSRIDCAALWYYRAACVPSGIGSRPSSRSRRDKTHSLSR